MDRHVILTLGRSGSNTLCDMLNQNPAVLNFGEVLGEWNAVRKLQRRVPLTPRGDEAFLDWVLYSGAFLRMVNSVRSLRKTMSGNRAAAKPLRDIETWGIKDFSLNFTRFGLSDYLDTRPDLKVVGLLRQDVVDRMISNAMLGATGVIKTTSANSGGRKTLRIDPGQIAALLTDIETENAELEEMLDRLPDPRKHVISYEDLFTDPDRRHETMTGVFDFLGVAPIRTEERMVKIIRTPVNEVIENFEECVAAVKGTPHEELLRQAAARGAT
ncbi:MULTISPECIES: sulfotransferase [unclassified Roseovarius]|uniref:sulfotransferase n=1 Tax=unclassified Roseovarius TaxID=2614913 RepID=UPI00273E1FD2|nr:MULTISPECIES: sulfotransferase [unclassified Roseovarius]